MCSTNRSSMYRPSECEDFMTTASPRLQFLERILYLERYSIWKYSSLSYHMTGYLRRPFSERVRALNELIQKYVDTKNIISESDTLSHAWIQMILTSAEARWYIVKEIVINTIMPHDEPRNTHKKGRKKSRNLRSHS